jgi:hypothetical protein
MTRRLPMEVPCPTGKIRYRDELDAMLALGSTARRSESNRKRRESRQYHCPICKGWHLTKQVRR